MTTQIMRSLFFTLLLLPLSALAEDLNCFPGDANADSSIPHVYSSLSLLGGAIYVWCDVGHKWAISSNSVTGALSDFDPAVIKAAFDAATASGDWSAAYEAVKAKFTPNAIDAQLLAAISALPVPEKAPPSGLVAQATIAYKQRQGLNTYTMVAIGSVPLGTPCNASVSAGGYYAVDVALVKMSAPAAPKPTTAYARCTQ